MNLIRLLVEKLPGVRYRLAQARMPILRLAFRNIGAGSVIVRPLALTGVARISIGNRNIIRDGAWLATEGESSQLQLGDNNYIGHRCHIHAIDPIKIGSGCVFADNVLITSADHERANRHAVRGTGAVEIADRVFLGQNVVVLGGVRIGQGATVAAGAVVVSDVAAGATVGGIPAVPITSRKAK